MPDPPGMSVELSEARTRDRRFLEQLLDPSKLDHYQLPPTVNATLRSYQQDGLNWMRFLNKYQLHGILCDDMGLGKTLQSICIVAGDHHECAAAGDACHPSVVVCPSTLTAHWENEFHQFCPTFRVLRYVGSGAARVALRPSVAAHDVVVLSYETLRSEADFFSSLRFNYCVLDEGHIIKNPKSKITQVTRPTQSSCPRVICRLSCVASIFARLLPQQSHPYIRSLTQLHG